LSVHNPDAGQAIEELSVDYERHSPLEIGFNARYLLDIIGQLEGETALLKLADFRFARPSSRIRRAPVEPLCPDADARVSAAAAAARLLPDITRLQADGISGHYSEPGSRRRGRGSMAFGRAEWRRQDEYPRGAFAALARARLACARRLPPCGGANPVRADFAVLAGCLRARRAMLLLATALPAGRSPAPMPGGPRAACPPQTASWIIVGFLWLTPDQDGLFRARPAIGGGSCDRPGPGDRHIRARHACQRV